MDKTYFYLDKIHTLSDMPIACYGKEYTAIFGKALQKISKRYHHISNDIRMDRKPCIYVFKEKHYGCIINNQDLLIIFGETNISKIGNLYNILIFYYFLEFGIELNKENILSKTIESEDLNSINFLDDLDYNFEKNIKRFNYEDEQRFINFIQSGGDFDFDNNVSGIDTYDEGRVGLVAMNKFKQIEYIGVSTITLATRAAISGGLDVMTAYGLSDFYLQRLENCKSESQITELLGSANLEFATKVKACKEKKSENIYVEKCKNYISRHKNRKFTIDDIAENIGISNSYLGKLFQKEEGVTIHQYTLDLRIEMGANLLKNTKESITSISEYLCFNSQSHFGKVFKEKYGVTPQKFRNKNSIVDFLK